MVPQELHLDLVVGGTLPAITSNFAELKAAISARLETYRIQVTEENLAQAKKDATELGKAATQLNKLKSEKAKEFSAPVEAFKAQVMELVGMIQEGQEFIKKQVAVFEEKTKALCLEKMKEALSEAYASLEVVEEYQTGFTELVSMVGISKVTKTGELTKAAKESVMALATTARGRQDRTNGRISTLTAKCYAAGLKSPLTRAHVENIILADDATYDAGLERLIGIEVERQQATLKAEQDRMEREAREKAERESKAKRDAEKEQERKEHEALQKLMAEETAKEDARIAKEVSSSPPLAPPPAPTPSNPSFFPLPPIKRKVLVTVTFEIETAKTSPSDLEKTASWFRSQIQAIPHIPPFRLEIR